MNELAYYIDRLGREGKLPLSHFGKPCPYGSVTCQERSGCDNCNLYLRHEAVDNMKKLEEQFRQWIDDRITDCISCPPLSEQHRINLQVKEDTYHAARYNLSRIAKEIREVRNGG